MKSCLFSLAAAALGLLLGGCSKQSSPTSAPSPTPSPSPSATLVVTFGENPVAFRSTGCNASTPQGWYTSARIQETSGVSFTARSFTQKLDGNVASGLAESFNSRFGPCGTDTFTEGMIPANGAVCGVAGVCSTGTFSTYQFELGGTDANGRSVTVTSPVLQLAPR